MTIFSPNKRQKLDSDNKFKQAKSNIQNLVNYLDNDIHLNKTDIVAVLTKDFCKDDILDITNTTMRTLQNKRRKLITRLNNKKLIKFTPKYDSSEFRVFKTHVKDVAPVKSGSVNDRKLPFGSYREFYNEYKIWADGKNLAVRSIPTITKWLKYLHVKPSNYDKYQCSICFEGLQAKANPNTHNQEKISKYEKHVKLYKNQSSVYMRLRDKLKKR